MGYGRVRLCNDCQDLQGTYPDYEALKESQKEAVSVC
jgi:hypothetical protein